MTDELIARSLDVQGPDVPNGAERPDNSAGIDEDRTEVAWAQERRQFAADERDLVADLREALADDREREADERDRILDHRERALDERELEVEARNPATGLPDPSASASRSAAIARRSAAEDREVAATRRAQAVDGRRAAAMARERTARRSPRSHLLAREFAELSVALYGANTLEEVLARIVEAATAVVPGCDAASITSTEGQRYWTAVATSSAAEDFDRAQYEAGQGPSLEAIGNPIVAADSGSIGRWPLLAQTLQTPWAAVVSCGFLLPVREPLGSLNLYSLNAPRFDDGAQQLALVLTAHAAVAVATAHERQAASRLHDNLREALASRDVIGQAKGILMERQRVSAEDAFDILRRASQRMNVKLRDVARHLATGGRDEGERA